MIASLFAALVGLLHALPSEIHGGGVLTGRATPSEIHGGAVLTGHATPSEIHGGAVL